MNKRILIADAVSAVGLSKLKSIGQFEVIDAGHWDRQQLESEIGGFHALIVRSSTQVDQRLLDKATQLEVVIRAGTGVDNIDVDYAKQKNVIVMNTPGTNAQAAAELTIGLMLSLVRMIPQAIGSVEQGLWERKRFVGTQLYQKTLGIIGIGNIGQRVAKIAHGFGMRVLGFDPRETIELLPGVNIERVDLATVQAHSDFISLHAALNPQTQVMIDHTFFAMMKPGAYLINCSRAELVKSVDLVAAIEQGHVAGAAVDVLPQEPPEQGDIFVSHPHILVTPHIGASTKEAQDNVMLQVCEQLQSYFLEGITQHQVM